MAFPRQPAAPPGVIINPVLKSCTGRGTGDHGNPTRDATSRRRPATRTAAIIVVGAGRARGASRRRRNRG